MTRILLCFFALALASAAALASPQPPGKVWMKVLLEGRKIGHMRSTRDLQDGRVVSSERMELTIERAGISLTVTTEETSIETPEGKPLGFRSEQSMSGVTTVTEGRIGADGTTEVEITSPGRVDKRTLQWPQGALLAEGLRLRDDQLPLREGERYEVLVFQPSALMAVPVKAVVGGEERVSLGLQRQLLRRLDHRVEFPGTPIQTQSWVTKQRELRKSVLPVMGMSFEMIVCSEACARAPNQSADVFDGSMATAPRPLQPEELANGLRFELELTGPEETVMPDAPEQKAKRGQGRRWSLQVQPGAGFDRRPPTDEDKRPTRWLESDSEEIVALAKEAGARGDTDAARMHALQDFVRGYIRDKSLSVGYASARETAQQRRGDCTEHALLLAALGRAIGIPTRVASGVAYAPHYAGRDNVFVPHAWVQAWVGDRWQSFDAALPGFDAGHVTFSSSDGDPSGYYASANLMGYLHIRSVQALGSQP